MRIKISFQIKLFLWLTAFFLLLFSLLGFYYYLDIDRQLYDEMGVRAKIQAEEIAVIPDLNQAIKTRDIAAIARLMNNITHHSDASFIVIGDRHAVHLYHSQHSERVGKELVGGDNSGVLQGKSTTTVRQGGIGISLRSKAPVLDKDGTVIGIVSVGYLTSHIDNVTSGKVINILLTIVVVLSALFILCWFFSRGIKKQMFSLEPREIGLLVRQQKALMESIYEGVIAVDDQLRIAVINQAAKSLLGISAPSATLRGKPLAEVIRPVPFFDPTQMLAEDTHDEICLFNQLTVIASRVRILLEDELQGWVISFRDRNEIDRLSIQLSQVQRYADNLRIMRHEQLNWTATLAGLLHMGRYDEAIRYIEAQSESAQEVLDFISARFCSPMLCGLLLGKYARAQEKGVALAFDPACRISSLPQRLTETELMSIIGNLLDNAIEATLISEPPWAPVEVYIASGARELVIEVADRGCGIAPALRDDLFTFGVTSKPQGDHGLGLHLVASYVSKAEGAIEVAENLPRGTVFSLFIPDNKPHHQEDDIYAT
ncbi:two-component system cit operon sensor histidine kinase CitA [Erwinia toletana]|uniref:histidine kinase n=1 Tax=Winslowiella toletana TaxID=92490 RepID=A0ABS4P480_9GAMM|nr:sensor histidine kinase [Winslowiella toletana]MBP2167424.1 two-component system cit operon sensor histidine kinase CitA [Winslowiella toletana]